MSKFKTIIASMFLTGCAIQPQVQPIQTQSNIYTNCVSAISIIDLSIKLGSPYLDGCLHNDTMSCTKFMILFEKYDLVQASTVAAKCIEYGYISPNDPVVINTRYSLPEFNSKLKTLINKLKKEKRHA